MYWGGGRREGREKTNLCNKPATLLQDHGGAFGGLQGEVHLGIRILRPRCTHIGRTIVQNAVE